MNANETDTESTRLELQGSTVAGTEGPDLSNVSEGRGPRSTTRGPLHTFAPNLDHQICETALNPYFPSARPISNSSYERRLCSIW